jgi:hypothetical protein
MTKIVAAVVLFVFSVGVASAEDFAAVIKSIDGNKVTLTKTTNGKKDPAAAKKTEPTTLTASSDVKVSSGKYNKKTKTVEVGDAVDGGLKSSMLTTGKAKCQVTTNSEGNITSIVLISKNKKKPSATAEE